jgi:hypothetical protein
MNEKPQIPFPTTKSEWRGKEAIFRTDRIIVKLVINVRKPDADDIKRKSEGLINIVKGSQLLRYSTRTGRVILQVPENTDIIKLAIGLSRRREVAFAEPDFVGTLAFLPNDTRFSEQWALPKIDAELAWDLETGANNVLIGITDTGISTDDTGALSHPDLNDTNRYLLGHDYINNNEIPRDDFGHGTHVCGIAAAESNNANGVAGLNWNSQVYICKTIDAFGYGAQSDTADAMEEIVNYALANNLKAVISMSLRWLTTTDTLRDACQYVHDNGMLLSIAAGNDSSSVGFPALLSTSFSSILAVGATDTSDTVASFSNTGPEVSVVAPGVGILSTFPTYDVNGDRAHNYVSWDGTSMATPLVAGLASLVWGFAPQLSNEQVRDVILNTAIKLGTGDFNNSWGHGRINAADAVAKAGWQITPVQIHLNFIDIPEGETQLRAVRLDVNSFHAASFEMSVLPDGPFSMHNYTHPATLPKTTDYDTSRPVHLWISYTGTHAGDIAGGTAQVRCSTTGECFDITITANTTTRSACATILSEQVIANPNGYIPPGNIVRIPFFLSEADISVDTIILLPAQGLAEVTIETPGGDLINSSSLPALPSVKKMTGTFITCYKMSLPVSNGSLLHAQSGKWNILLRPVSQPDHGSVHGIRYTALIQAYSNLRMKVNSSQNSYEPGARFTVRCLISEYGAPLEKRTSVSASAKFPDHSTTTVPFLQLAAGIYEASLLASFPGTYEFTVFARGFTSRNRPFTREQILTAAIWHPVAPGRQ